MSATGSPPPPGTCFVGLGGNIGDAAATLRAAFDELAALPGTRLLRASQLYRTPAWGMERQPDFINAVAMLDTRLAPQSLLEHLLAIECRHGRVREDGQRWGPRTLDLDLLLYGDAVTDQPGLHVPHPQMHLRAFVLRPLVEIAPDAIIPGVGPAAAALEALADDGIRPLQ
ncbi:2-amino-4-hydroxy-6-hydroxymethyldihydropteridine diphosphokinase [Luteimonas cucumeris]|uniref:2-amino-4-hydroxy-6-hydroxymethyldihydropteridine pyrophosphokinase n=1 Tax=Luteimonas cucumeris TaxID=985012 RepID=A0A562LB14_9GAMM|nr:2-amino-4-hydroxy-6-hydroxymethyldihydropteridine diphosphokinase [Luteimonas cucumeris]TWI04746.1 2-amino-4-hydroxy-6-hydroxymethyldihydropteridine diphosphokinase [Luteimonas cucumeris]